MFVIVSLTENRYRPWGPGLPWAMRFAGAAMVTPTAATATPDPRSVAIDRLRRIRVTLPEQLLQPVPGGQYRGHELFLATGGEPGDRYRAADRVAGRPLVAHRRPEAPHAEHVLLVVDGVPALPCTGQVAREGVVVYQRVRGQRAEVLRQHLPYLVVRALGEQRLAERRGVRRQPAPHAGHRPQVVLRLPGGQVDHVGAVEPGQVHGLRGGLGEPVQGLPRRPHDVVAVDVGGTDEQRAQADAVERAGAVGLHPAEVGQRAQQHVEAALGIAEVLLELRQAVQPPVPGEVLQQLHRPQRGLDRARARYLDPQGVSHEPRAFRPPGAAGRAGCPRPAPAGAPPPVRPDRTPGAGTAGSPWYRPRCARRTWSPATVRRGVVPR